MRITINDSIFVETTCAAEAAELLKAIGANTGTGAKRGPKPSKRSHHKKKTAGHRGNGGGIHDEWSIEEIKEIVDNSDESVSFFRDSDVLKKRSELAIANKLHAYRARIPEKVGKGIVKELKAQGLW